MQTFKAFCSRSHERVEFDDGDVFEQHMRDVHHVRPFLPGQRCFGDQRAAAGWRAGKIQPPHEWTAPRPDRDKGAKRIGQWEELGYVTMDGTTPALPAFFPVDEEQLQQTA